MKIISSRDNPLYKSLLALTSSTRALRKRRRALLDGPHLVQAYRHQMGLPEMLVVSETGMRNSEVQTLVESHRDVEVIQLRDSLFQPLSGVASPVGILSVIPIPEERPSFDGGSCVLLDAIQDAGNLGSILRTTSAAGINDVFLGAGCAAAWSSRVLRAAQGAHFRLHLREQADLIAMLQGYSGRSLATVVSGGMPIYDIDCSGDIAWLFGSEGQGLSQALIDLATHAITIPLANNTESLNVAAAAAICLFRVTK
jgi:TrmH family RNA methyltransferase